MRFNPPYKSLRGQEAAEQDLIGSLGSALKHLWVPLPNRVTLSGVNTSTVEDMVGGATMSYVSGSTVWIPANGSNPRPYVALTSTDAVMNATGVSLAAGRIASYAVVQLPLTAGDFLLFTMRDSDSIFSAARMVLGQTSALKYRGFAAFSGGAQDISSTAVANNNWHLMSIRPAATGASFQVDGVEVSPTFSGTDTISGIGTAMFGHPSLSGGNIGAALLVDTPTADQHAAIVAYAKSRFRIG